MSGSPFRNRNRPDGLLPAFSMMFEFEVEGAALRAGRHSIDDDKARIRRSLSVASDWHELPFSVHLAILFKVYRMTLRLHSVLSLSPAALTSKSARKSSPAAVSNGMDFSISASMSARK